VKPVIVAAAVLAVVLGAIFAFLSNSSGPGSEVHTVGVIIMLAGLAVLAGILIQAVASLRRTGKHRRLAAGSTRAQTRPRVQTQTAPSPSPIQDGHGSGSTNTDNFGSGYSGSHAARTYGESAARRDTSTRW
jgi:hypothetical protein